jgi:phosphoenolpyruvate carboxylase
MAILWRTGEIYLDKPDLQSERRNVIDYLTKVFPATIRPLDIRLRQAWKAAGLDASVIRDPLKLPRLTFGTWIGGDRDGHPLVTADVTRESLAEMRRSALSLIQRELLSTTRLLSLSAYWIQPPPEFLQRIAELSEKLGTAGRTALTRNPNEPWRQFLNLIIAQLPNASRPRTKPHERTVRPCKEIRARCRAARRPSGPSQEPCDGWPSVDRGLCGTTCDAAGASLRLSLSGLGYPPE